MKRCTSCQITKSKSEFSKNVRKKDGLQTCCKACARQYAKAHYQANKEAYIEKARSRDNQTNADNHKKFKAFMLGKVCQDCGITDVRVLQFDHVRGTKSFNVSTALLQGYSWDRILTEIKKCDIVCANCHTLRTASTQDWRKVTW